MFAQRPYKKRLLPFISLILLMPWQVSAAWYEAQGEAPINQGDRLTAKSRATEDAIRQALLFAGASVKSVQTLTNGLLQQDRLQITANGDVKDLQLVNERWHDGKVSVTIRADIFPTPQSCTASQFKKTLVTTWFPLENRQQAQDGQIHELSVEGPRHLQQAFQDISQSVVLEHIAPYTVRWNKADVISQAPSLARQSRAQFVLAGVISDVSLTRASHSPVAFWKSDQAMRQFALDVYLIDGMNGAVLLQQHYRTDAIWEFDRFEQIDVSSNRFWQSEYGLAAQRLFTDIVEDVDNQLTCQPATGRVLDVNSDQLQVSIGRSHGLRVGDELSVYTTQHVRDPQGMVFLQYNLYPTRVKVVSASVDSATVEAVDNGILANIQPNDFVAKR